MFRPRYACGYDRSVLIPIERIARLLVNRRENGPRCQVCGARTGTPSARFCSDEHAQQHTEDHAW